MLLHTLGMKLLASRFGRWAMLLLLQICVASALNQSATANQLNDFATKFWAWRSETAPITSDDLPRTAVIRPSGWAPNVSSVAFIQQERIYEGFVAELRAIRGNTSAFRDWTSSDQTDYWALTSALNRVYWELYILVPMARDPGYYLQQSYGSVWDCLVTTRDGWREASVHRCLLPRLSQIPSTLDHGTQNLHAGYPTSGLGELYLQSVTFDNTTGSSPLGGQMIASAEAVISSADPPLTQATADTLRRAAQDSAVALGRFTSFVAARCSTWTGNSSIGEARYSWFLRHVSFLTYSTGELVDIGRQQLARAETMLQIQKRRNDATGVPPTVPLAKDLPSQINATVASSRYVRNFLEKNSLLHFPAWFNSDQGYTVEAIPPWLAPFDYSSLGEEDDFTSASESRAGYSFQRYVPSPRHGLPFFLDSMARDARPVVVHEGIPGHWTQFRWSWRNQREARRHWLDSTANEGLAYYFEETLLQARNKPPTHTQLCIYPRNS